ncbi:DUF1489 family protein [Thalassospira sp.]|uniref:DUF1489 family protein n=1 Tax=Thalassospira sp. TaxID=1912094 RepID=UPI00273634C7|nr:DUF1489 domain-containing protein [Thalassospira sp.]MDP2700067.1 DUF1489 domain-containing protein [Thalassospira sp.]
MPLHLLKLSVGSESPDSLRQWQAHYEGLRGRIYHTTRQTPKQRDALLAGGSIYWVIKGAIRCRQLITDLEDYIDDEGIKYCRIILDRDVIDTATYPHRAFQGWRYLTQDKCPPDAHTGTATDALPDDMAVQLRELGLI